ncbi:MAG TPA: DedA family protein [Gammaproteobacteria bacterium]|nr:DedA family protein [Gammaproteobacteria bacterium]
MTAAAAGDYGLWALFVSAFVSSTLLPGGSEVVLLALAAAGGWSTATLLLVASAGNALGGMTSWGLGRYLAWRFPARRWEASHQTAVARLRRFGAPVLLLSWLPLVGDPLCLAAGWLRVSWWVALVFIALGKGARYALLLLLV